MSEEKVQVRTGVDENPFNPILYEYEAESKIITLIDKISKIMKAKLWEKAKKYGITETQGQIILHLLFSPEGRKNISFIAEELGVSKPTISRAVDNLIEKGLVEKSVNPSNRRSHILSLTPKGVETSIEISGYAKDIRKAIGKIEKEKKNEILLSLLLIISKMVENNLAKPIASCIFCTFMAEAKDGSMFCSKLNTFIKPEIIKIDCSYFESKIPKQEKERKKRKSKTERKSQVSYS